VSGVSKPKPAVFGSAANQLTPVFMFYTPGLERDQMRSAEGNLRGAFKDVVRGVKLAR
jgi:hypothetical protein